MEKEENLNQDNTEAETLNNKAEPDKQSKDKKEENKATEDEKELYERGSLLGEAFILKALDIRKIVKPKDSSEENLKELVELTSDISSSYVETMNEFYTNEGKSLTGWIIDDISYCSGFYESVIKD